MNSFAAYGGGMERNMTRQRHKRKESFSVLIIPNTEGKSKQFHVSRFSARLAFGMLALICLLAAGAIAWGVLNFGQQEVLRRENGQQKQRIGELETERDGLAKEKDTLAAEIETLKGKAETGTAAVEGQGEAETVPEKDTSVPRRYPYTGISTVLSDYSEEQPYLSLNTNSDGNVVATGDGMVTVVDSDDTYAHIIEVEHNNGYKTRYMCRQEVQVQLQVGAQVQAGDILMTVLADDTQLDYQVEFEGEQIDPLTVFEAKG